MTPWTTVAAWKYLRHTDCPPRTSASYGDTGTGWAWYKGPWLFWLSFQGKVWHDPGGPALPHHLQCGGRCGTLALGHRGGRDGGYSGSQHRGFQMGHPMTGGVFLCQRRPPGINAITLDTSGIWCPDGVVWPGWAAHQCGKDSDHGVPTLLRDRGTIRWGLRPQDYWRGNLLPGQIPPVGPLPWVWLGPWGGIPGESLSSSARDDTRISGRESYTTPPSQPPICTQDISNILPSGCTWHRIPSGKIPGAGHNL